MYHLSMSDEGGPPLQREWYIPGDREPIEGGEESFEGREERPVGQQTDTLAHVKYLLEKEREGREELSTGAV